MGLPSLISSTRRAFATAHVDLLAVGEVCMISRTDLGQLVEDVLTWTLKGQIEVSDADLPFTK